MGKKEGTLLINRQQQLLRTDVTSIHHLGAQQATAADAEQANDKQPDPKQAEDSNTAVKVLQ